MSYQVPNINKLNQILQLSEADISSLVDKDVLNISMTTKNPILKATDINSIIPDPFTRDTIYVNNINSATFNGDLNLDASGTGSINLNTVNNLGVVVNQTANNFMSLKLAGPTGDRSLIFGRSDQYAGELQNTICGADNIATTSKSLALNSNGTAPVIIGPALDITASNNKLYVIGNIGASADLKLADNGTNYHSLQPVATTGQRNHQFIDRSSIIAATYQNEYALTAVQAINIAPLGIYTNIAFYHWRGSDFTIPLTGVNNAKCWFVLSSDNTADIDILLIDNDIGATIGGINSLPVLAGDKKYSFTFNMGNLPAVSTCLSIQAVRNAGAATVIYLQNCYMTLGLDSL